jgi:hypothetical protein
MLQQNPTVLDESLKKIISEFGGVGTKKTPAKKKSKKQKG